ncbi:O-antigen ligase family protein [Leucobacter sp.]
MGSTTADDVAAPRHGDARHPSRDRLFVIGALFLLVVVGVVPWRSDAIYSGGVDGVVAAKAAIAVCALAGAALLRLRTRVAIPIGLGPAGVLSVVALVSLLGAFAAGNGMPTLVLVARVLILMATVLLLLSCAPWGHALACLLWAMAIVAVVAAVTGIGTLASGRLGGGVPEIHPNELAELAAVPLIGVVVLALRRGILIRHVAAAAVLLAIVVSTGSRSALLAVGIAAALAVLTNGRLERRIIAVLLISIPVAYVVATFTGFLDTLASRGGTSAATGALDSRFDAWRPVLAWPWESWEKWIGLGLSVKEIEVDVKWLDTQVLDSSWVSLLAQAGIVGMALTGALLLWCAATALVSRERRGVLLPMLVLIVMRSLTESGLVDSATPLILFLAVATLLTRRSRHGGETLPGTPAAPADSSFRMSPRVS